MIVAGCDVGSLTAEAVIVKDDEIISSEIIRVRQTPVKSAEAVMGAALKKVDIVPEDVELCCSTGYGRNDIPFASLNMSEISCHGMGAFWLDSSIQTIIDIGGQDSKIISIDRSGMVSDFIMNDKCAAGTGRCLEILSRTLGIELEKLGSLSKKSKRPVNITNKCSIFMELEVLNYLYGKKKKKDIASGINEAVARRVASLARMIDIRGNIAITGGVSKNCGVVACLEKILNIRFTPLPMDPQLIGALGAAVFALNEIKEFNRSGSVV